MQKAMPMMQVSIRALLRRVLRMMYFWLKLRRRHSAGMDSSITGLVCRGGLGRMHAAGHSRSRERLTRYALPTQHTAVSKNACSQDM